MMFWWWLLGAKATCEVTDREEIAKEPERKICSSECRIKSNNPNRPHFPQGHGSRCPYGLHWVSTNATMKGIWLWSDEAAALLQTIWGSRMMLSKKGGDFFRALRTPFCLLAPSISWYPTWVISYAEVLHNGICEPGLGIYSHMSLRVEPLVLSFYLKET